MVVCCVHIAGVEYMWGNNTAQEWTARNLQKKHVSSRNFLTFINKYIKHYAPITQLKYKR